MELKGVLPALVTPFSENGERVDDGALRDLVDRLVTEGVDGLVPCGGTGEFTTLSVEERRHVVEVTCEQAAGRVPVVAQTGSTSTREAIELSKHAEKVGASVLMVSLPYYDPLTADEAFTYYQAVAGQVELPIMVYNYPYATGRPLDVNLIIKLSNGIRNVKFLKDSAGVFLQLATLLADHRRTVTFFCGEDLLVGPAFLLGTAGILTGTVNFLAPHFARMAAAAANGDDARVVKLWRAVDPILRFTAMHPYVSAIKTACRLLGHPVGPVRAPLSELAPSEVRSLQTLIARFQEVEGAE